MPDLHFSKPSKPALRKQALAMREQLPIAELSHAICTHLGEWSRFQQARQVLFYFPFRNEVDLRPLCRQHPEKEWYLPAVMSAQVLIFRRTGVDLVLQPGTYGIPEPPEASEVWSACSDTLLFVPGVLFAGDGYRLGYGKGYYDRFFSQANVQETNCIKVGIVPTALIQAALPHDAWDVPMDFLATELDVRPISPVSAGR